jgi:hypothetical protein
VEQDELSEIEARQKYRARQRMLSMTPLDIK